MTAHIKRHKKNEQKPEKDILHEERKWNCHAHDETCVLIIVLYCVFIVVQLGHGQNIGVFFRHAN